MLKHLQQSRQIFACLESEQYILPFVYSLFQIHFLTDSLPHSLSHLNIISSFFIYYFFNNYTSSNIFLFNTLIIIIEKKIWRMKNSSSGYCSLAKKNLSYREAIRAWTVEIWRKCSLYFGYPASLEDALNRIHIPCNI